MQQEMVIVGLDPANNVLQIRAIGAEGRVIERRQLRRAEVLKFFGGLPSCIVGM